MLPKYGFVSKAICDAEHKGVKINALFGGCHGKHNLKCQLNLLNLMMVKGLLRDGALRHN